MLSNCPILTAWFDIDGKLKTEILEVSLTHGIYPHGRCCQGKRPKLAEKYPVYELNAKTEEKEGFKIFLFDRRHFSKFRKSFFEFEGDHIKIGSNEKGLERKVGFEKYRVKMIEEHHLEDDPIFGCKEVSLFFLVHFTNWQCRTKTKASKPESLVLERPYQFLLVTEP